MPLPQLDVLQTEHPDLARRGDALLERLRRHYDVDVPRHRRMWSYYRNPMLPGISGATSDVASGSCRPYRQAQEWGLPPRITGLRSLTGDRALPDGAARKEVVIENDIAWRVDALIDALFGRPIVVRSTAPLPERCATLDSLLRAVLSANGGIGLLQRIALLGAVYGYVDVLVKFVPPEPADAMPTTTHVAPDAACDESQLGGDAGQATIDVESLAKCIRFEVVEPARSIPLLCPTDGSRVVVYGQTYLVPREPERSEAAKTSAWSRLFGADRGAEKPREHSTMLELISPHGWTRHRDQTLVGSGPNPLGRIPLVHIQNAAVPFEYAGAGDVEPLMPLQDELNTRLSDRAYRITMQSFKMYLGKGLDDFTELPVAPGRMWSTENPQAEVIEFGGDGGCPSEESHIADIREALDKTSGVSPVAAGAIRGRIGNLTSAAALRVTMQAMLARVERRRTTYGPAIAQMCELALAWLDAAGLFKSDPTERGIDIDWPDPIGSLAKDLGQFDQEQRDGRAAA
jgi:hypothetical protein